MAALLGPHTTVPRTTATHAPCSLLTVARYSPRWGRTGRSAGCTGALTRLATHAQLRDDGNRCISGCTEARTVSGWNSRLWQCVTTRAATHLPATATVH